MSEVAVCRETWSHSPCLKYVLLRRATQTKEGEPGAAVLRFCSLCWQERGLGMGKPRCFGRWTAMLTENVDSAGLTRFRSGRPAGYVCA